MIFFWDIKYNFGIKWDIVDKIQYLTTTYEDNGAQINIYVASQYKTYQDNIRTVTRWNSDNGILLMQEEQSVGTIVYGLWLDKICHQDREDLVNKIVDKMCEKYIISIVDDIHHHFSFSIKRKRPIRKKKNI